MLDRLPVWTVSNEQGQPLQYQSTEDGRPLALFYSCVDAARDELESARKEHPTLGLDIVPMGLGEAFRLCVRCADNTPLLNRRGGDADIP